MVLEVKSPYYHEGTLTWTGLATEIAALIWPQVPIGSTVFGSIIVYQQDQSDSGTNDYLISIGAAVQVYAGSVIVNLPGASIVGQVKLGAVYGPVQINGGEQLTVLHKWSGNSVPAAPIYSARLTGAVTDAYESEPAYPLPLTT